MVDNMKNYKVYSTTDVMLIECKLKLIQLSCFTDLNSLDWLNTPVYDLMYVQPPNADAVPKDEQDNFEKVALRVLGRDIKRPKFLTFSQWIQEGGSGLQTLWSMYYLDLLNADKDKPLIYYHFERFHPLCYQPLLYWLLEQTKSREIMLLSTNATVMLDCYTEDKRDVQLKKFIELNDGSIVTTDEFIFKIMGLDKKVKEQPWLYNVEKMYRKYCEFGENREEEDYE